MLSARFASIKIRRSYGILDDHDQITVHIAFPTG